MTADPAPANPLLRAALWYARQHWPVFPCHAVTEAGGCSCGAVGCENVAKHPRTKSGLHDATTAETVIRAWWQRWPDANVAVRTGEWLTVLDIDLHEQSGFGTLLELEGELGKLPETVTAITGSGGHHRYFRPPAGVILRNSVGHVGGLGPGLDVRAERGYVLVPPSTHETLTAYRWAPGLGPHEHAIAELPAAWVERLTASARPKPEPGREPIPLRPGNRNSSLTSLAGAMRRHGADEATIRETLSTVNGKLDEPLAEQEVGKIAGSVARYAPEPNGEKPRQFMRTDLGNAERFIARHGQDVRYCEPLGGWLRWTGTHWQRDATEQVRTLAHETVRAMYAEAAALEDPDTRAKLGEWAAKSEASARIAAMLTEARPYAAVLPEAFDRDPWLLCCTNGVLELKSATLREHRRADHITRCLPFAYDAGAAAPIFTEFVNRIMGGRGELVEFLARALGYALSGDTSEQCFFVCWGSGENGKSTLLRLWAQLLGGYGRTAEAGTFLDRKEERVSNDLAGMAAARFVLVSEGESGQRLAENLVKRLTGQDTIAARFLFHEYFEYEPAFKLWFMTNHKPEIRDTGAAMWRRVRLIPFEVTIPKPEQDKHLPDKLKGELPGILAWAVRGCLDWLKRGDLEPPEAVLVATQAYRDEMDVLGPFLAERCVFDPQAAVKSGDLYRAYAEWCDQAGDKPLSKRAVTLRLAERGVRLVRTESARLLGGVRLRMGDEPRGNDASPPGEMRQDASVDLFASEGMTHESYDARVNDATDHDPGFFRNPAYKGEESESRVRMRHASGEADSELALENPQPVTEPSAPYPGCWLDGCLAQLADIDSESGDWCAHHLERRQCLNLALLLGWPAVDLGGGEVVEGRDGWQAFARAASDTEIAFAADALSELLPGGVNDG